MKLFDYKFLILLALTLVVYFMFREIIDLRNKVDDLENKVKVIELNPVDKPKLPNVPKPELTNKPVFQIPLPPAPVKSNITEPIQLANSKKLSTVNEDDATEQESETQINSASVEKLEIYSNDNLENNDDDFSIGDSSEIDLNAIEEELNASVTSEESEVEDNKEEDIVLQSEDSKKKNLLVEFEGTNLIGNLENLVTNSDKDIDNILSSNTSDIKSTQSGEYSYRGLMKLKLAQLQCMAEEQNIDLINEEKGKKKTKSELSNEILLKLDL